MLATSIPHSWDELVSLGKSLIGISPEFLIPFVIGSALWIFLHLKIANKAGYSRKLGLIASIFPLMYLVFAFSTWPIQDKLTHFSGVRYKGNKDNPIAPNYPGRKKKEDR